MAGYTDKDKFTFVLLGKTGSGKSATGNTILGKKKRFKVSGSFESVTTKCEWEKGVLKDGTTVEVVDTPGLCDTNTSDKDTAIIITKTVTGMHPGAHAMIYVLKADRFTEEEQGAFKKLEAIFDHRLYDYLIVVIMGGDNLEEDEISVEDTINNAPGYLKKLLKDCDNRYVVFNNRSKDPAQVDKLLQMVKGLVRKNSNKPHYSCDKYAELGNEFEDKVKKGVACVEEELLKEKEVFQEKMKAHKKKMDEAVRNNEKTKEEADRLQKEYAQNMKSMKEDHQKQLKAKEEEMREDIKRKAMESKGSIWKTVLGATLLTAGSIVAPVAAVLTAPVAGAAAVTGMATGGVLLAKGIKK